MSKLFCVFRSNLPCASNSCTSFKSSIRLLYCSQIRLDKNEDDKKNVTDDKNSRNEDVNDREKAKQKMRATLEEAVKHNEVNKTSDSIESSSPDMKTLDNDTEKRKESKKKLNDLLQEMTKVKPTEKIPNVKLPRPRVEAQKKYNKEKAEFLKRKQEIEKERIDTKIGEAAIKVAETLGGDTKKTEKELLDLYLGRPEAEEDQTSSGKREELSQEFKKEKPFTNMKEILLSLKVEKEIPDKQSRVHQVKAYKRENKIVNIPIVPLSRTRFKESKKIDILGAEPLGIFTTDEENKKGPPVESVMWDFLQRRDLKLSVTHPPANIYEQLILWTEQGKIWKFPINNEQDWEEENVDFTEHVFLEHMLEPWCLSSGLIRHFMELVCVGLSKNPYLSVKEKHAHIIFYEHYFRHKNSLLINLGLEPIKDRPQLEQAAV